MEWPQERSGAGFESCSAAVIECASDGRGRGIAFPGVCGFKGLQQSQTQVIFGKWPAGGDAGCCGGVALPNRVVPCSFGGGDRGAIPCLLGGEAGESKFFEGRLTQPQPAPGGGGGEEGIFGEREDFVQGLEGRLRQVAGRESAEKVFGGRDAYGGVVEVFEWGIGIRGLVIGRLSGVLAAGFQLCGGGGGERLFVREEGAAKAFVTCGGGVAEGGQSQHSQRDHCQLQQHQRQAGERGAVSGPFSRIHRDAANHLQ